MATLYNPALYQEPRNQPIKVAPPAKQESLLSWLESTGRLLASENDEFQDLKMTEDLDGILDPEIYGSEDEEPEEELD